MSAPRPFPALNSADNSRSGSPAPEPAAGRLPPKPRRHHPKKPRQKPDGSSSGNADGARAQRPRPAPAPAEPGGASAPEAQAPRPRRRASRRGGSKKAPRSESAGSSRPASAQQQAPPPPPQPQPQPQPRRAASGTLSMPVIIADEDGRARVVFSSQPAEPGHVHHHHHHRPPPPQQQRRSTVDHVIHGRGGLGLGPGMQPEPAGACEAPPGFCRHHSMGPGQLHAAAQRFAAQPRFRAAAAAAPDYHHHPHPHPHPHPHSHHHHHYYAPMDHPPATAPPGGEFGARARSQSVSAHASMTGLRISLAQSQPGNVMSPHLHLPAHGAQTPQSGYFASRRASVSDVGLAVDPSHSIRIPTIMFQKQRRSRPADDSPAAASLVTPNTAEPGASPVHAVEDGAVPGEEEGEEGGEEEEELSGEDLAMRRLQDMIASLRALSAPATAAAAAAPADPELPPVAVPPTPAAHPTSRFDSILEEDEDTDEDEDEDGCATAAAAAAASRPASALCAL
ncbi:hypothetical protein H4R18_000073 [Coemansia javaensis]|uniref:Uncharacterized protein n=1 Tax=Coemansia javaensis TaxID=2761396 RepID=A0A9W8HHF2_9FUNG|nr:hypothetical protein H4R18_000073 [Coemansia javaensis]